MTPSDVQQCYEYIARLADMFASSHQISGQYRAAGKLAAELRAAGRGEPVLTDCRFGPASPGMGGFSSVTIASPDTITVPRSDYDRLAKRLEKYEAIGQRAIEWAESTLATSTLHGRAWNVTRDLAALAREGA